MKIGDEVYVHGYVDEIRKDCVIIRNEGGYFGTSPIEVDKLPIDVRTLVDGLSAFVTRFNPFSDESLWICKTIELLEERAKQTEPRDLAQDLATGKESILSLAIKGKMERRQKRQTEPSTGVADCPWK